MLPVEAVALKEMLSGAVPEVALVEKAASRGRIVAGLVKTNGVDWGLSVPLLNVAARVKLAVSELRDTRQSRDVAAALVVWHACTPSW